MVEAAMKAAREAAKKAEAIFAEEIEEINISKEAWSECLHLASSKSDVISMGIPLL